MINFANIPKNNAVAIAFGSKEIGPYYWVGNCKNGVHYYAGQTFKVPVTGILKRIQLFASIVYRSSEVTLSIYQFDNKSYSFERKLSEITRPVNKTDENQWITFTIPDLNVEKTGCYAFKFNCEGTGMIAIAECPWKEEDPYRDGVQWTGSSVDTNGSFHRDFDFAFEGVIEASPNAQFI